ncbi:uncharacterized protein EHS24_006564 [Apiotrichum porosum]|uniref:F-box domain-containing protein n=1 Tax=Apiotrichum porosum TaxID=105984 RepID=A0A427Y1M6_9TREE|nr:uncharacterized protein EHS24_006564 [Apiotrichum porosum]RSH84989.1 hypothetical protein EHS24_006564 [Apiotrichum porosum]
MIDHDCYPHLMDLIVHHAPSSSLLALRPASRTFRDVVDAIFTNHIVVSRTNGCVKITSPLGRIPTLMRYHIDPDVTLTAYGTPYTETLVTAALGKLGNTHTITFATVLPEDVYTQFQHLASVQVVRYVSAARAARPPIMGAKTNVFFCVPRLELVRVSIRRALTRDMEKLVLNVPFDTNGWVRQPPISAGMYPPYRPTAAQEVVIILTRERHLVYNSDADGYLWPLCYWEPAVSLLCHFQIQSKWHRYTVVGAEDLPLRVPPNGPEVEESMEEHMRSKLRCDPAVSDELVHFATRDEYRLRVGDRQFELETAYPM